jgi:hypothetical protein
MAGGLSIWQATAAVKQRATRKAPSACMCGREKPSLSHLLWNCEATGGLRLAHAVTLPTNCAEERLMCCVIGDAPPPPIVSATVKEALVERAAGCIAEAFAANGNCVAATDGSEKGGIAACGIVFVDAPAWMAEHETPLDGEEQTAYAAEVFAMATVLRGLDALRLRECRLSDRRCTLTLVMDCKSAIEWVTRPVPSARARLHAELRGVIGRARVTGWMVRFAWVPSHGRIVPSWSPSFGYTEEVLRAWNERADVVAGRARCVAERGSDLAAWEASRTEKVAWSEKALDYACEVHGCLRAHVEVGSGAAPL